MVPLEADQLKLVLKRDADRRLLQPVTLHVGRTTNHDIGVIRDRSARLASDVENYAEAHLGTGILRMASEALALLPEQGFDAYASLAAKCVCITEGAVQALRFGTLFSELGRLLHAEAKQIEDDEDLKMLKQASNDIVWRWQILFARAMVGETSFPVLETSLGAISRKRVEHKTLQKLAFLVLHELAHIRSITSATCDGPVTSNGLYLLQEPWSRLKAEEIEADTWALDALPETSRAAVATQAIELMSYFVTIEYATKTHHSTHPSVFSRMQNIGLPATSRG